VFRFATEPLLKLFRYDISLKIEGDVHCLAVLLGLPPPHPGIILMQDTHVGKTVSFNARLGLSLGEAVSTLDRRAGVAVDRELTALVT
jgi:hypothetical protein